MIFLQQFAVLISASIPIIRCCEILETSQDKIAMRLLIFAIKKEILAGKSLYFSFKLHPYFFDHLFCQLINVGEQTGKLDIILATLALHKEKQFHFRQQLKATLFYPCLVLFVALIVIFIMLFFIVPRFQDLFADHEHLPLLTRAIFFLATACNQNFFSFCIMLILIIGFLYATKMRFNFFQWQNLPIIKPYLIKSQLANFARTLALTYSSGLTITESLKLITELAITAEFKKIFTQVHAQVCTGIQLNQALSKHTQFPPLMVQMIQMGEESGRLEVMLNKIADFFESEIERLLQYFNKLLDPLIMLGLGGLIGLLLIGLYLPIFKIGSTI